jgi:hypothetical protein
MAQHHSRSSAVSRFVVDDDEECDSDGLELQEPIKLVTPATSQIQTSTTNAISSTTSASLQPAPRKSYFLLQPQPVPTPSQPQTQDLIVPTPVIRHTGSLPVSAKHIFDRKTGLIGGHSLTRPSNHPRPHVRRKQRQSPSKILSSPESKTNIGDQRVDEGDSSEEFGASDSSENGKLQIQ